MSAVLVERYFTKDKSFGSKQDMSESPAETRDVEIKGAGFEQKGVEAPADWSDTAVRIAASKYFAGPTEDVPEELLDKLTVDEDVEQTKIEEQVADAMYRYFVSCGYERPFEQVQQLREAGLILFPDRAAQKTALLDKREGSVYELVHRVAKTIADWGYDSGYFNSTEEAKAFYEELYYLLINQRVAFNSPVWFNIGAFRNGQGHACFIQSVEDDMDAISTLAAQEVRLFKQGSGTGTNFSSLRSSYEKLSTGGKPSGPCSFMKWLDAGAACIKSGGRTRRSAKMSVLNAEHPDVEEFITLKTKEEAKARALIKAGFTNGMDGEAYTTVAHQNCNYSVRVDDEFMEAVEQDYEWKLLSVINKAVVKTVPAREIWESICQAAWDSGDPGLQYDDTIHKFHTCKADGRQRSTNPCGEYLFLDETACNLASFNLLKFYNPENDTFDIESFRKAVAITFIAQDILIDHVGYPSLKIAERSRQYRTIGMGFSNLGALLMAKGMPYDSDQGRSYAAHITALMCGEAYRTSAIMAQRMGAFPAHAKNKESMDEVMRRHASYWPVCLTEKEFGHERHNPGITKDIDAQMVHQNLQQAALNAWNDAVTFGDAWGFRNAQATLLAPTGTVSLLMDCDTTGVEPAIGLIAFKQLAGGGMLKLVNRTVPLALKRLGHSDEECREILAYVEGKGTVVDAPHVAKKDYPVFQAALTEDNQIEPMGHVRMMAAVQPFLSGAISKTVNCPKHWRPEDISDIYMESWKMGLKCMAIYRDGSKGGQPLKTTEDKEEAKQQSGRNKLPTDRHSLTHKFEIGGHTGFVTIGLYPDGRPGEIFINMSKEGSTMSGLMDCWAKSVSMMLQHGVELEEIIENFKAVSFPPAGLTRNQNIRVTQSPVDYVCRLLEYRYVIGRAPEVDEPPHIIGPHAVQTSTLDAPPCANCGAIMHRAGSCFMCRACGETGGCS